MMASMEMLKSTTSTSTNTGVNCNKAITSTVAAKVKSAVMTSSPGWMARSPSLGLVNAEKALVIDIRPAKEYSAGHIVGAVNIPQDKLILTLGELSGVSGGTNTMKLLRVEA